MSIRVKALPQLDALRAAARATLDGGLVANARLYALRELARRAGVSPALFSRWRLVFGPTQTEIQLGPNGVLISLAHDPQVSIEAFEQRRYHTLAARDQDGQALIVPFVFSAHPHLDAPLFETRGTRWVCRLDLLLSVFATLTRIEELVPTHTGREPGLAPEGSALRDGYLHRPVIDELGLAFGQVLRRALPGWTPTPAKASYLISSELSTHSTQVSLRSMFSHVWARKNPRAFVRDAVSAITQEYPTDALSSLGTLASCAQRQGLTIHAFVRSHDTRTLATTLGDPRMHALLTTLRRHGVIFGARVDAQAMRGPAILARTVGSLRQVLTSPVDCVRQDATAWSLQNWSAWEHCNLRYDHSLGHPGFTGYRCGTCVAYQPWNLPEHRPAKLLAVPLIVQDPESTRSEALASTCQRLVRAAQAVGGTVSWNLHEHAFSRRVDRANAIAALASFEGLQAYRAPDLYQHRYQPRILQTRATRDIRAPDPTRPRDTV